MVLELPLSSEIESRLRERATALGQGVEAFVAQAVTEKLAETEFAPPQPNPREWAEKLRACIELHPVATGFVDDSRESIYAGRGE